MSKEKKKKILVPPYEIKRKIRELSDEKILSSLKCPKMKNKCAECGFKFSKSNKDLDKCPMCGTVREKCSNLIVEGGSLCRSHGGKSGRPVEVDEEGIPRRYVNDKEQKIGKHRLKKRNELTDEAALECSALVDIIEDAIDPDRNEKYDLEDLQDILRNKLELFKTFIKFEQMRNMKTMVDKMPSGQSYSPEALAVLKEAIVNRAFAIAANSFMESMRSVIKDEQIINDIFGKILAPVRSAYDKQDIYFDTSYVITEKMHPELLEGTTVNVPRPITGEQSTEKK